MRALIQRVSRAQVSVEETVVGAIGRGFLVFLGVKQSDTETEALYLAARVAMLRVFNDGNGKMNLALSDVKGSVLVVSQFTLHADTRKGHRPSYVNAADPQLAEHLYDVFVKALRQLLGQEKVSTGVFRSMMEVELVNEGPVTVMLGSKSEYM